LGWSIPDFFITDGDLSDGLAELRAGHHVLIREEKNGFKLAPEHLDWFKHDSDKVVLHAKLQVGEQPVQILSEKYGFGLHLPGGSKLTAIRAAFGGRLGYSAHSIEEALAALDTGADYVFLSPIWQPISKPDDTRPVLGLEALEGIPRVWRDRVVALGGVNWARRLELKERGFGMAMLGRRF
jgi:hypothetical protein